MARQRRSGVVDDGCPYRSSLWVGTVEVTCLTMSPATRLSAQTVQTALGSSAKVWASFNSDTEDRGIVARIKRVLNQRLVDMWRMKLDGLPMNRFERTAATNSIEAFRHLLSSRDALDAIRDRVPPARNSTDYYAPLSGDQRKLFRATKVFFDEYYSTLSSLSGFVARNYTAFQANFSDNARFLDWVADRYSIDKSIAMELSQARLFRAMLAHPQQFPPYEWATVSVPRYELLHIVLYGPLGRGKNPVPRGAVTDHELAQVIPDWQFDAPDEISVTNALGNVAVEIYADVLTEKAQSSSFIQARSREGWLLALTPESIDSGWTARTDRSLFDDDHLPPRRRTSPWTS